MNRRWLALSATAVLVLAACGGDDGGGSSGGGDDFCDVLTEADDLSQEFFTTMNASKFDGKQIEKDLDAFLESAKDAEKDAPKEVKGDISDAVDTLEDLKKFLDDRDYDEDEITKDAEELSGLLSDLGDSGQKIQAYLVDECGAEPATDASDETDESDASDLSDLSDITDLTDFSDLSDLSDLSDELSDFSDLTDISPSGDDLDQAAQILQQIYPKLSYDEARCFAEKAQDLGEDATDPAAALDVLEECGIEIGQLTP